MRRKIKVGIAGYGVVGRRRKYFMDCRQDVEVVAVCDQLFEDSGRDENGLRYYQTYEDLLDDDLDALFICISNDMAPIVTTAGLQNNLHVFCEKPPGRNLADIEGVRSCEAKYPNLKLKYGFNHRYHESVKSALEIVRSGELGDLINIKGVYGKSQIVTYGRDSDWRTNRKIAGGGILLDQGIHMVDLIRLFSGDFSEIHSFISNKFWNHDVEDNAYAIMRSAAGVVAMLHSSATQWRHRFNLELTLAKGTLILEGILSGTKSYGEEVLTIARSKGDDRGNPDEEVIKYDHDPSWEEEIEEFVQAILSDNEIVNGSSQDALDTMRLVYQIYCADRSWRDQWSLGIMDTDATAKI